MLSCFSILHHLELCCWLFTIYLNIMCWPKTQAECTQSCALTGGPVCKAGGCG